MVHCVYYHIMNYLDAFRYLLQQKVASQQTHFFDMYFSRGNNLKICSRKINLNTLWQFRGYKMLRQQTTISIPHHPATATMQNTAAPFPCCNSRGQLKQKVWNTQTAWRMHPMTQPHRLVFAAWSEKHIMATNRSCTVQYSSYNCMTSAVTD